MTSFSSQRSPVTGAPLQTLVGGGPSFSKQRVDPEIPPHHQSPVSANTGLDRNNLYYSRVHGIRHPPKNTQADRGHETRHPEKVLNHGPGPCFKAQILGSPEVMRAFKFDESRIELRRPLVTHRYAWYDNRPRIELPENPTDTTLYSKAYASIVKARDQERTEVGKSIDPDSTTVKVPQKELQKDELPEIESLEIDLSETKLKPDQLPNPTPSTFLKPLTPLDLATVQAAWSIPDPAQKVAESFRIIVTARDIQTLRHGCWLNDTVIDFYLAMVTARSQSSSFPSSFAFTSHFFSKLQSSGFEGVKRWAKRKNIDVTKLDYIFVPINRHNSHWCLAVINNKDARFEYYDSMNGRGTHSLRLLRDYMIKQTMQTYPESRADQLGYSNYEMEDSVPCPQQENVNDCGVFACVMAEFLSREAPLSFTQQDMPNLRLQMAYEIINQQLLS